MPERFNRRTFVRGIFAAAVAYGVGDLGYRLYDGVIRVPYEAGKVVNRPSWDEKDHSETVIAKFTDDVAIQLHTSPSATTVTVNDPQSLGPALAVRARERAYREEEDKRIDTKDTLIHGGIDIGTSLIGIVGIDRSRSVTGEATED